MTLLLGWRVPDRPIATRWRGPVGMAQAVERDPSLMVAAIVGPPGPAGPPGAGGAPVRIDASLASTWILANPLGRIPSVQVYLFGNEIVLTDVQSTTSQITVTFPSPQQGFVLAF